MARILYRHLAAWDEMMGSSPGWAATNQRIASEDAAPGDAVYWTRTSTGERVWTRFADVTSARTRLLIGELVGKGEGA